MVSFLIDNMTALTYLLKRDSTHCKQLNGVVRKTLLKCQKISVRCSKPQGSGLILRQKGPAMESRGPHLHWVIKAVGNPSGRLNSQTKGHSNYPNTLEQTRKGMRETYQNGVAKGPEICLSTLKHNIFSSGQASENGGPDNGHTMLAGPELVSKENVTSNRTTKAIPFLRVAFVECIDQKSNP